jgi:putative glutamine amidotransferase
MPSSNSATSQRQPIIGFTSYQKKMGDKVPLEMIGVAVAYVEAILAAGGIPLLIPLGLSEADLQQVFARIDGLLLPGGGDVDPASYNGSGWHRLLRGVDKRRDELEFFMARRAVNQAKPLLAICRGHQVLNVVLGGSLWQDLRSEMPEGIEHDYHDIGPSRQYTPHTVEVLPGTKLAGCLGEESVAVNSLHHQGIRELAPELEAVAWAADGLIEAVEIQGHPFAVGVQWHPENLVYHDPAMMSLFKSFVEAANRE